MPLAATDRYLAEQFHRVKGASSKIGAIAATRLVAAQTERGLRGAVAEIGVFEGRFFIALALAAAPGEKLVATDVFTWPDEGVADRFLANCRAAGVDMDRLVDPEGGDADADPRRLPAGRRRGDPLPAHRRRPSL